VSIPLDTNFDSHTDSSPGGLLFFAVPFFMGYRAPGSPIPSLLSSILESRDTTMALSLTTVPLTQKNMIKGTANIALTTRTGLRSIRLSGMSEL
jgi:hypothetical protein